MKKKVLFIGIGFYEYDSEIKKEIESLGYDVNYFSEEPSCNFFENIFMKFKKLKIRERKTQKIQNLIVEDLKNNSYNFIFVIKGHNLNKETLEEIKKSKAKKILYVWDDTARMPNFYNIKNYFDKIYSFDNIDCEKEKMDFLPLFYTKKFETEKNMKKDIDIYFSGWNHSDRIEVIKKILLQLKKESFKLYLHIFSGILNFYLNKLKGKKAEEIDEFISFKKLSMKENSNLTKRSKILIDIQHPTQKGLTMRTIEALGAGCKLITTNDQVKNYDFYNPNNIFIINRENPQIDIEKLKTPYEEVDRKIVEKYSLSNFLKIILGV